MCTGVLLVGVWLLASSCGRASPEVRPAPPAVDAVAALADLFDAVAAGAPIARRGGAEEAAVGPLWPLLTYLRAEGLLAQGDRAAARAAFAALARWAVRDHPAGPYGDARGGSGVAAFALWRWLELLRRLPDDRLDRAEVDDALAVGTRMRATRLYVGVVRPGLLPASPALEARVAGLRARLAWRVGHRDAASLFVEFLAVASPADLDDVDPGLYDAVSDRGLVAPARLALMRARRGLGASVPRADRERALDELRALWRSPDAPRDVRLEAGYEWALYERQGGDRDALVGILTRVISESADVSLAERALYARGLVHNRGRRTLDAEAFRRDMRDLVARFPSGRLADDALYQLASHAVDAGDPDGALDHYRRLRDLGVPHDFEDSAYYVPALVLFARGAAGDLRDADRLLATYAARHPDGPFRLRALFWRGRIAERRDHPERAERLFRQVIDEGPFDYYGLRARLHRELGPGAAEVGIPEPGSRVRRALGARYRASRPDPALGDDSPYHGRLRAVVAAGVYRRLLDAEARTPTRLDVMSLDALDAAGGVPAAALLLAIRQDALAARDLDPDVDHWLRLAGFLGRDAGDWPLALEMIAPRSATADLQGALQADGRYLASAYPHADTLRSLRAPLSANAWAIGGSTALSASLMYAVMRQESRFYPKAISRVGALGLFQFMPATFRGLEGEARLRAAGLQSDTEYLLDPARNIALWADWMQREHRLADRDAIAITLMRHQAGSGNVRRWLAFWDALGVAGDLEYEIETARFAETRNFVRWTLRDLAIVDASGMFGGGSDMR